jgi:hypothetical protein
MQTITVDIINSKVLILLKELESLQFIKLRKDIPDDLSKITNWKHKYKGAMSKQDAKEIDNQLNELRNEWD